MKVIIVLLCVINGINESCNQIINVKNSYVIDI